MRSARGDRHPPNPWRSVAHRGRATHLGLSKAGAEPSGFLLPHHMPKLVLGLRDGHVASLFIPRASPQLRPHPLLSGPWSPLSL